MASSSGGGGGVPPVTTSDDSLDVKEINLLKKLDSRSFGFLGQGQGKSEAPFVTPEFIRKGINWLLRNMENYKRMGNRSELVAAYSQLGHLHLLLEDYKEAMSAYQLYQDLADKDHVFGNVNVHYGMALIYFHSSQYDWCVTLFDAVLSMSPDFARLGEVHLKIAVSYMRIRQFRKSMDHFVKALNICGPASFGKLEILYHIGHLYCLLGQSDKAKKTFEDILSSKAVPNTVKAMTLRQLGWMACCSPEPSDSSSPQLKAEELLKMSVGADPAAFQSWYFLGRCHASNNNNKEAFTAYQQALERCEEVAGRAGIYISIGLLFQKMDRLQDSVQAYITAVYLDRGTVAGWVNLGALYESSAQPMDSLLSYTNALSSPRFPMAGRCRETVSERVCHLERLTSMHGQASIVQPTNLPSLEYAWTHLISDRVRRSVPLRNPPTFLRPCDIVELNATPRLSIIHPVAVKRQKPKCQEPIILNSLQEGWRAQAINPHGKHCPPAMPQMNQRPPPVQKFSLLPNQFKPQSKPAKVSPLAVSPGTGSFPVTSCENNSKIQCAIVPPPSNPTLVLPGPPSSLSPLVAEAVIVQPCTGKPSSDQGKPSPQESSGASSSQSTSNMVAEFESYLREYSDQESTGGIEAEVLRCGPISEELELLTSDLVDSLDSNKVNAGNLVITELDSGVRNTQEVVVVASSSPVRDPRRKKKLCDGEADQPPAKLANVNEELLRSYNSTASSSKCIGMQSSSVVEASLPVRDPRRRKPIDGGADQPQAKITKVDKELFCSCDSPASSSSCTSIQSSSVVEASSLPVRDPRRKRKFGDKEAYQPLAKIAKVDEELLCLYDSPASSSSCTSTLGSSEVKNVKAAKTKRNKRKHSRKEPPVTKAGLELPGSPASLSSMSSYGSLSNVSEVESIADKVKMNRRKRTYVETYSLLDDIDIEPFSQGASLPLVKRKRLRSDPAPPSTKERIMNSEEPSPLASPASVSSYSSTQSHIERKKALLARPLPRVATTNNNSTPCSPCCPPSVGFRCASVPVGAPSEFDDVPSLHAAVATPPECIVSTSTCSIISAPAPEIHAVQKRRSKPGKDRMKSSATVCDNKEIIGQVPRSLSISRLHPQVDIYEVTSRDAAFSDVMHNYCTDPARPTCIIRNLCPHVGLDIQAFSSTALAQCCPKHVIEVREQNQQAADENWDGNGRRQVWKCESGRSTSTVAEYARYQRKIVNSKEDHIPHGLAGNSKVRARKTIKFATNIDLSDKDKWKEQLQELDKLPPFLRVNCPETDLLSYVGHNILGMNSAQLYMKVPGCRTPGHQENNNFCSVNINIGPGVCSWFAVDQIYWKQFHVLCQKHKLNYLTGSWWPILKELEDRNIPVYRFTQYQGDVVWLNPGTVHWVQADTSCNNVAWNVGPITAHQFQMAWERYQWNMQQGVRSIVPMLNLTWNIARNVRIRDTALHTFIKALLHSNMEQTYQVLKKAKEANLSVYRQDKAEGEISHACHKCQIEVYNILFVAPQDNQYQVFCMACASKQKKEIKVLQQFDMAELETIMQSFELLCPLTDNSK